MAARNIWKAYLNWLNFRKAGPGTPLLGNPMNIRGHAPEYSKRQSPFSRPEFGKYERRRERARRWRIIISVIVLLFVLWVIFETIRGLILLSD